MHHEISQQCLEFEIFLVMVRLFKTIKDAKNMFVPTHTSKCSTTKICAQQCMKLNYTPPAPELTMIKLLNVLRPIRNKVYIQRKLPKHNMYTEILSLFI